VAGHSSGGFVFQAESGQAVPSALYNEHLKLTGKPHIAPFAGFLMPLWYSSISAEHRAVRQAAGIFDCTHMGVLEVAGIDAADFLDFVTTNHAATLPVGRARYSYILDAAGNVLDDVFIYRRDKENFMVVVNAANEPKIKAYFQALKDQSAVVDTNEPSLTIPYRPGIRDMKDSATGADSRVDIALQGPAAAEILCPLLHDEQARRNIAALGSSQFCETTVAGTECIVSRTGYTGSKVGLELFVHPDNAASLWQSLLEAGRSLGLVPCGLGARDSLRTQAGLPLYGHELDGEHNISPFEAGYGWAVKLDKPFFIGKAAMEQKARSYDMVIIRLQLPGTKGIRPVRQNDAVLDQQGECIGWITSCAKVEEKQFALAYVTRETLAEREPVGVYYVARSRRQLEQGRKPGTARGDKLKADITGVVLSRFERF